MSAVTVRHWVLGMLCLVVSGLGAGLYLEHLQRLDLQAQVTALIHDDALARQMARLDQDQRALQRELAALRQAQAQSQVQPSAPATPQVDPRLAHWAQELQRLRQALTERATQQAVQALQTRLEGLEQRLAAPKPASVATAPTTTVRPKPPLSRGPVAPPFALLGIENRGGERFLAVAPRGSHSLAQVRLLHPGERIGSWQLKALGLVSARFAVSGPPEHADQTLLLP